MLGDDVSVKCRNCGNSARAADFVLDSDYKMMVCPDCIKKKGKPPEKNKKLGPSVEETSKPQKPTDWDSDDEYLARAAKKPRPPQLSTGMKLKCKKCDYVFEFKDKRVCPYCDSPF